MAGRKPSEAVQNFLEPLQLAASCVTNSIFRPTENGYRGGTGHALILNKGQPVQLAGPDKLQFSAQLQYDVVRLDEPAPDAEGPWKVVTRAYRYHVITADLCEVVLWHWHPGGSSTYDDPHMHLGQTQLRKDAVAQRAKHHPTGRIAFEQVLLQLIAEYDVAPTRDDWEAQLDDTLARFARWRTW